MLVVALVSSCSSITWGSQVFEGRNVDLLTQKGGKGYGVPCSPFQLAEEVILYANVTYNGYPCSNYNVAFQISDPHGNNFIFYAITNMSGIATTSFRLPTQNHTGDVFGTWIVLASVNIAEVVVTDTLEIHVRWKLADVNDDLKVDVRDIATAAKAFDSFPGHPKWNSQVDITGAEYLVPDGKVNMRDIVLIVTNFGEKYP